MNDIRNIDVVVCEPGKYAHVLTIPDTLSAMQHLVGGYIECVPLDDNCVLICNEDGKNLELPLNRVLYDRGQPCDIIRGTFFIAASNDDGEFISLEEYQKTRWMDEFYVSEFEKTDNSDWS